MALAPLTKMVRKEEVVVTAEQQIAVIIPKLSTIFRTASIDLKQIRYNYGYRSKKEACAFGAIRFYLGDNEDLRVPITKPNTPEYMELMRQMILLHSHLWETYGKSIIGMNDEAKWSFTRFAEECEMLGI